MLKRGPLRDGIVLALAFGLLLGGLSAYARTWPPAVIVESGSMMHADDEVSYGRIGTIDPGDLVVVKRVASVDEVVTLVEARGGRYGMDGDVIVYHPAGDEGRTPIIHRAVAYVEVLGSGEAARYRVRWSEDAPCEGGATRERDARATWCVFGNEGVLVPSVPIRARESTRDAAVAFRPTQSGFFTKGDNPATNRGTDQEAAIAVDERGLPSVVPLEWIVGKARGELPWMGLLKLSLAGKPNERSPPPSWIHVGWAAAPKDLWVMLGVALFVLVGVPVLLDVVGAFRRRARRD